MADRQQEYDPQDSQGSRIADIHKVVQDTTNQMRENINLVNDRGANIEEMDATARNLGKSSYEFRKTAQRSKLHQQFRKWKWTLLIALIVIILIIAIAVGVTHGTRK